MGLVRLELDIGDGVLSSLPAVHSGTITLYSVQIAENITLGAFTLYSVQMLRTLNALWHSGTLNTAFNAKS